MSLGLKRVRLVAVVVAMLTGSVSASQASPIGLFSWQQSLDFDGYTLAVEIFSVDWPAALSLDNLSVSFTDPAGDDSAYFGGYTEVGGSCVGGTVSLNQSNPSYQVPGYLASATPPCDPLTALPQTITSATLNFIYDTSLGTVTVGVLGPVLDETGAPSDGFQFIDFEETTTPQPVPEPATMVLMATGLSVLLLRARRKRTP